MSMCVGRGDVGTYVEGESTYISPTQISSGRLFSSRRGSPDSDYH